MTAPVTPPPPQPPAGASPVDVTTLAIRTAWAVGVGFLCVLALATWLRPDVESLAQGAVHTLGYPGVFASAFLAEAVHFPTPPHFTLLLGISGGMAAVPLLVTVCCGSMLGGMTAYALAGWLAGFRVFARLISRSRVQVDPFVARYGWRAFLLVSITPFPFATMCMLCGAYGIRHRLFAVMLLLRIPRIALYHALITLGWG